MQLSESEREAIRKGAKGAYKKEMGKIKTREAKAQAQYDSKTPIRKILSWFGL